MRRVHSAGPVEARLRRLEHAINFAEWVLAVSAVTGDEGSGAGGGTHRHTFHEVPAGPRPGTAFTLASSPDSASEEVVLNGLTLRRVFASPGLGEYAITGNALTTGDSVGTGDRLWCHYTTALASSHTHVMHEVPSGTIPGTTFTLAATPLAGSERVLLNGLARRRVASGPSLGEYSITGATLTIGQTIQTGDRLWAHYLT